MDQESVPEKDFKVKKELTHLPGLSWTVSFHVFVKYIIDAPL